MPLYFFSTYHDVSHIDEEGEEFDDKHAARQEADEPVLLISGGNALREESEANYF
jgi:hypothetical protein